MNQTGINTPQQIAENMIQACLSRAELPPAVWQCMQ